MHEKEIKKITQDILKDRIATSIAKDKFISEIKTTLGPEIKKNPSGVKIKEKTRKDKIVDWFKKIFNKL